MDTLALKIIATPLLILAATLAGQRWGETISGWFVGLPVTSGPIVFFLALDQGPVFAAATAGGSLAGAIAEACFCVAYAAAAARFSWAAALAFGSAAFGAASALLRAADLSAPPLALIACAALVLALRLIPGGAEAPAATAPQPRWGLPLRMAVATALVLLFTEAAPTLGPRWSGLLATYPVFAAVLAAFGHQVRGAAAARRVLRGLLAGLFGFCGFFLVLSLSLEQTRLGLAFAAAVAAALLLHAGSLWLMRRGAAAA